VLQKSVFDLIINGSQKSRDIAVSIVANAWTHDEVRGKLRDFELQAILPTLPNAATQTQDVPDTSNA
jgi:hypothetical protein